jgi:hypothetical protein
MNQNSSPQLHHYLRPLVKAMTAFTKGPLHLLTWAIVYFIFIVTVLLNSSSLVQGARFVSTNHYSWLALLPTYAGVLYLVRHLTRCASTLKQTIGLNLYVIASAMILLPFFILRQDTGISHISTVTIVIVTIVTSLTCWAIYTRMFSSRLRNALIASGFICNSLIFLSNSMFIEVGFLWYLLGILLVIYLRGMD